MQGIRGKLWFGLGSMLLMVLVASGLSAFVLTRYSHALESWFRWNYDSVLYCQRMTESLDALDQRARGLACETAVDAQDIDAPAERRKFELNLALQIANISVPGEGPRTDEVARLWRQYRVDGTVFDAVEPHERLNRYRQVLFPRYRELRGVIQSIADLNLIAMASEDNRVRSTLLAVRGTVVALAAIALALAVVVTWAMGRSILEPLKSMTRSARQIEGGNLDLTLRASSDDEVGQLAAAFNSMASKLREFRRLDHERLERSQQTTQLAIDSLPDAVFVIGPEAIIEMANRTARQYLRVEPGASVNGLHIDWLSRLYAQVLSDKKPLDPQGYSSAIQVFEDGDERFLLPRAAPMFDAAGHLIGVTVILVDVTRLRKADELKSDLLATVSHELRTPLTSVRMATLLLADERLGPLLPRQKKLVYAARDDSDRLYRTIENLLGLSRIEARGAQLQPMMVAEMLRQALDPLRQQFAQKQLELTVAPFDESLCVSADPSCVGYALTNLLTNAIKFVPAAGRVAVHVRPDSQSVVFEVADTGPGIPAEFAGRVFDRFFRVPSENGPPGVGLGLAIAREIVEAHNGTIEYASRDGGGAIFRFAIPRAWLAQNSGFTAE